MRKYSNLYSIQIKSINFIFHWQLFQHFIFFLLISFSRSCSHLFTETKVTRHVFSLNQNCLIGNRLNIFTSALNRQRNKRFNNEEMLTCNNKYTSDAQHEIDLHRIMSKKFDQSKTRNLLGLGCFLCRRHFNLLKFTHLSNIFTLFITWISEVIFFLSIYFEEIRCVKMPLFDFADSDIHDT